ncbi:unnamed protein product [Pylaiella littoralis]
MVNENINNEDTNDSMCPNLQTLDALVETFERTYDWSLVIRIGDMYAKGCYPSYAPDDESALKIYKMASKSPDRLVSSEALYKYTDLRLNPLSPEDRKGRPFPRQTSDRLIESGKKRLRTIPLSHFMKGKSKYIPSPRSVVTRGPEVNNVVIIEDAPLGNVPLGNVPLGANTVRHNYTLDTQNVHDHGVSASVRENIKSVISELGTDNTYDRQEVIESVMNVLRETGLKEKELNRAFRVIVSLVPDMINSIGCSQMDVLNATFKKIQKVKDPNIKKNLFESLGKNLASGIERNNVVCSTGKIGRIITTLEGVDHGDLGIDGPKLQKAVPIEVVRTEISALASKVRTDVLSECSDKQVSDYNMNSSTVLSNKMNSRFRGDVKKIYVDGLHLSEKVLDPIVDMYASAF